MAVNERVSGMLEDMARMLELLGEDSFRVSAHARAARAIADWPAEIGGLEPAALREIPGVGPKLADKIAVMARGEVPAEYEALAAQVPAGLMRVLEVPGLGPKTVRAMWQTLGITDLAGLEAAIADGRLLTLPRMGEKAVEKIRAGVATLKSSGQRLWLGRAWSVAGVFLSALRSARPGARVEVAGSLRRGKDTIGDIDIVAACDAGSDGDAAALGAAFVGVPGVAEVLASGPTKWSVRVAMSQDFGRWKKAEDDGGLGPTVQVDLRVVPRVSFGAAWMYFTGSKEHNVRLRERAQRLGMTLNEWGLFRADQTPGDGGWRAVAEAGSGGKGGSVAGATEESVFAALGLAWVPPELREDRGEVEAAGDGGGVPTLVRVEDIRAELHAHTTASDGRLSIEALASEALARGFHTIAVTDHSRSSAVANGLSIERLREHARAVRGTRVPGITILAGSEVDILADGTLDYPDEVLAELDVVVASPHTALTQDPESATRRLVAAASHPRVNVLGHPTGRLINRRAGLSPDIGAIARAASANGVALEINAHWMRLDLRDVHVRAVLEAGCLIAINCDVHERGDFDNLAFGVSTARRGWCPPERVVNTWPADRLRAWLAKRGA